METPTVLVAACFIDTSPSTSRIAVTGARSRRSHVATSMRMSRITRSRRDNSDLASSIDCLIVERTESASSKSAGADDGVAVGGRAGFDGAGFVRGARERVRTLSTRLAPFVTSGRASTRVRTISSPHRCSPSPTPPRPRASSPWRNARRCPPRARRRSAPANTCPSSKSTRCDWSNSSHPQPCTRSPACSAPPPASNRPSSNASFPLSRQSAFSSTACSALAHPHLEQFVSVKSLCGCARVSPALDASRAYSFVRFKYPPAHAVPHRRHAPRTFPNTSRVVSRFGSKCASARRPRIPRVVARPRPSFAVARSTGPRELDRSRRVGSRARRASRVAPRVFF